MYYMYNYKKEKHKFGFGIELTVLNCQHHFEQMRKFGDFFFNEKSVCIGEFT